MTNPGRFPSHRKALTPCKSIFLIVIEVEPFKTQSFTNAVTYFMAISEKLVQVLKSDLQDSSGIHQYQNLTLNDINTLYVIISVSL